MEVDLARLVSMTAGLVDNLTWAEPRGETRSLRFEFRVGEERHPGRLDLPPGLPCEIPEVFLEANELRRTLPHVDDAGKLCFTDEEGLSLSLRDTTAVVATVLEDAHRVLAAGLLGTNRGEVLDELRSYWALRTKGPEVKVAVEPGAKVKALRVWRQGEAVVLVADRAQRRFRYGQGALATEAEHLGLYLPLAGERFDRPFVDALAAGQVSLSAVCRGLGTENRKILAARLRKRRVRFVVFGVAVRAGQRILLGADLTPPVGREAFDGAIASRSVQWTARSLTRVDRSALLPRGGVRENSGGEVAMVIGCGAVGGHVAAAMARAGLRRLILVDPEALAAENIYRHTLGFDTVGEGKAPALARQLEAALPHIEVRSYIGRGEQISDRVFADVNLVIVTVGTPTIHRVLNRRLQDLPCRVVFGWLEPMGIGGHALLAAATGGGCLECLFLDASGNEQLTAWSDFAAPGQTFARNHAGCGGSFTPFADLDARRTANLVVELALQALTEPGGPGRLRSWLGPTEVFERAGFRLSDYRMSGQLIEDFRQTRCPVCAGW